MSASEMPIETEARPADPLAPMPWNALMTPTTVPSRPTNGAVDPMVARADTPFLRSDAVSAAAQGNGQVEILLYPGAGHAFFSVGRPTYDAAAAATATARIERMLAQLT